MVVDGIEVLTADEARTLTDREFRRAFIGQIVELVGDFGTEPDSGPVDDMPWMASQDEIDRLTIEQMREIVIQNQHWFYPKELRRHREMI